jgi:DegV family protein with EDD domain
LKIGVVTDSTSDLPPDIAATYGIRIVPLNVRFGVDEYLDGVTMQAEEFYRRLESSDELPTTSQPAVPSFVDTYRELLADHDSVVSVHLSSKLSATHTAAVQARNELGDDGQRVEVVDTLQASMALGWVAVGVAQAINSGANVEDSVAVAHSLSSRAKFIGLVETLEYLHKGGRIGNAQKLLGSLLRIKPMLELRDGIAHPLERARSKSKGIGRIQQLVADAAPLSHLCIMYTTEREIAEGIAASLDHTVTGDPPIAARQGPVVGTYLGPGSIGACYIKAVES